MVISNHFLYKDLVHHPIETTIYKRLALGFRAAVLVPGRGIQRRLKIRSFLGVRGFQVIQEAVSFVPQSPKKKQKLGTKTWRFAR